MVESNSLIKASAGTGKTFALATRFIRQMLIDKVDPKTIVALTFSRAAAQEIYTKILVRLCAAATDKKGADKEWSILVEDFRNDPDPDAAKTLAWIEAQKIPHAAEDFRRKLRELVDTQHLGAIATLDSFILRIVKNFPKEMGFQNAVEVLDPIDESAAVEDAVRHVLSKADGSGADVAKAFVVAKDGEQSRTCLTAIEYILNKSGWRNFVLAHPECTDWTVAGMCAALDVPLESVCPDLSVINTGGDYNPAEKFVQYVRAYTGDKSLFPSDPIKKMMLAIWCDENRTDYGWTTDGGRVRHFEYGAEGAAAIRGAITHMMNLHLKHQLEIVKAKIDLVKVIETSYERMTRRAGKLTFNDFTKFSSEHEFSERGIAIKNVQFRFDSQFDHWALDEFQDTSELQWKCLKELVGEVANAGRNGERRSAMAVGDLKQSIYTWRGASAQPFEELAGWPAFDGCARDLRASHRYGPNIAAFVNRVFGRDSVKCGGIIPTACKGAVNAWAAGWIDHVSNEAPDYVKVIGAVKDADPEEDDEILPALYAELKVLWDRHDAEKSKNTVAVLVRNNDKGLKVSEYLRGKGLPIVWEGMSPVHDLPVVEALLALLKLGDHPEDGYAWKTIDELFDVRRLILPDCADPSAASAAVSRLLARQGLARALKDFCGIVREKGGLEPNGLASQRLKQLVERGVDYESRASGGDVDGFVRFLTEAQQRELAVSSDVIRVLTIHRSKGLGFDHVFVPLFEGQRDKSAIDAPTVSTPLYDGGQWVLSHLKKGCEAFNAKTRAAYAKMRSDRFAESLRTFYVALTRSKKSLYVIFPDDSNPADYGKGLLMRDLIATAIGGNLPYEVGVLPSLAPDPNAPKGNTSERDVWTAQGTREVVERSSPSKSAHANGSAPSWLCASSLFDSEYGYAAQKGVDVHAEYAKIEWLDATASAKLPEAFRAAFLKPSPDASVWRERNYELFDGKRWETGQFDRVVFSGPDESRTATIYDFKTNARGASETDEAFERRMTALYAPQMAVYRQALSRLTGIPQERIVTKLLLEETGRSVQTA